ncbi:MAG: phosphopantetheine-binding protein [Flavobacteriaceae bacterium]|nr:phosphopantetheine-binding protein [Flavobacteriaceae bacterium]
MDIEEIINKTNEFLIDEFEVEEDDISPEANLKETLELDSLDYIDLVVSVESNFNVKLDAEDFENTVTLQDFYDLIYRKLK